MVESLLVFVIWLIVVGFIIWVLTQVIARIPMDPLFKTVATGVVVVVGIIILLLQLLHVLTPLLH